MKKVITLLALALTVATTQLNAQAIEVKYDASGSKKELRENKKVYISEFVVQQLVQKKAMGKAGGGLMGGSAYTHMTVDFGDVDPVVYQQLVTDVYNHAIQKFTAAGFQVITPDEAKTKTSKEFKTADKADEPKNTPIGFASNIRPKDVPLTYSESMMAINSYVKIAKELDALVFMFDFPVDFANMEGSKGGMFSTKATSTATANLSYTASVWGLTPKGAAIMTIKPVKLPDDWVGPEGFTKTKSGGISGGWFGGASSSSSKYKVDINQDKYLAYLKDSLSQAVDTVIDTFVQQSTK